MTRFVCGCEGAEKAAPAGRGHSGAPLLQLWQEHKASKYVEYLPERQDNEYFSACTHEVNV